MPTRLALVADADPDHRQVVASALREGGFLVLESHDEHDLLRASRTRTPDVVLLDLGFAAGGWRIIETLQDHESTCDIPVIALSEEDVLTEAQRLWSSGFCGYLRKPVAPASLAAAVRYCLQQVDGGADWVDLSSF
jgi:DNA-binding response OmpR family regulator